MSSHDEEFNRDAARDLLDSVQRSISQMKSIETERVEIEPHRAVESSPTDGRRVEVEIRPEEKKGFFGFLKGFRIPGQPWSGALVLYLLTWLSTTGVGTFWYSDGSLLSGLMFSAPLMTILTCHELGHYLQNRRYRIPTSPPYFIPLPIPPLGTLGAIIFMRGRLPNSRALFDVGVSGPLAGLAVTLVFLFVGMALSTVVPTTPELWAEGGFVFSEPLVVKWIAQLVCGYDPATQTLMMHPVAVAAWVGVLLTTINLVPIGQLDGGHVFYALLRKRARACSYVLFGLAVLGVVWFRCWNWLLFLALLVYFGLRHPQSRDDLEPLDLKRKIIGWATLAFVVIGFSPNPIDYREPTESLETPAVETTVDGSDDSAAVSL